MALDYETPLDRCTDDTSFLCQSDSSTVFRHRSLSLTNPHAFWLAQTCLSPNVVIVLPQQVLFQTLL